MPQLCIHELLASVSMCVRNAGMRFGHMSMFLGRLVMPRPQLRAVDDQRLAEVLPLAPMLTEPRESHLLSQHPERLLAKERRGPPTTCPINRQVTIFRVLTLVPHNLNWKPIN